MLSMLFLLVLDLSTTRTKKRTRVHFKERG
jgi:hypothetical protein